MSALSKDTYSCNSDGHGQIAHQRFPDVVSCQPWTPVSHSLPSLGCCPPIGSSLIYGVKYGTCVILTHISLILSEHLHFET